MNDVKDVEVAVDRNPFALSGRRDNGNNGGMIAVASSRQAQEVQAMMAIAKRFPREEQEAYARIMQACQRKGLAEAALYSYPRGGQQVTGPSIRLAEALAQSWGNLDFGVIELEQRDGESTVMAYCVDLQSNTRQTKVFQVPHERKSGQSITKLTDPRDIYEMVANQGARRLRSCILGVIPGDVIDAAVDQCDRTMKGGKEPLVDRIRVMATRFSEDFQVSVAMLEKRLQHKLDVTSEAELVGLRKIYTSLRDGMTKREDWFILTESPERAQETSGPSGPDVVLGEKPKRQPRKAPTPAPAPTPPPPAEHIEHHEEPDQPGADTTQLAVPTVGIDKGRLAVATAIRKAATENGVSEVKLNEVLAEMKFGPPGTTLNQLPSDTLGEIVANWGTIMEFARADTLL